MSILNPRHILVFFTLIFASVAVQAGSYGSKPMEAKASIVEIAAGNEDFTTLVAH